MCAEILLRDTIKASERPFCWRMGRRPCYLTFKFRDIPKHNFDRRRPGSGEDSMGLSGNALFAIDQETLRHRNRNLVIGLYPRPLDGRRSLRPRAKQLTDQ